MYQTQNPQSRRSQQQWFHRIVIRMHLNCTYPSTLPTYIRGLPSLGVARPRRTIPPPSPRTDIRRKQSPRASSYRRPSPNHLPTVARPPTAHPSPARASSNTCARASHPATHPSVPGRTPRQATHKSAPVMEGRSRQLPKEAEGCMYQTRNHGDHRAAITEQQQRFHIIVQECISIGSIPLLCLYTWRAPEAVSFSLGVGPVGWAMRAAAQPPRRCVCMWRGHRSPGRTASSAAQPSLALGAAVRSGAALSYYPSPLPHDLTSAGKGNLHGPVVPAPAPRSLIKIHPDISTSAGAQLSSPKSERT